MKNINCKFFMMEVYGRIICEKHKSVIPNMCEHCPDRKAKEKYNNKKTVVDNIKFDSKKECSRWHDLSLLEKSGEIKNLKRQVRFEIVPKTKDERAVFYVADFVYEENGKTVVEDTKSAITKKNPTYIIKRKLFKYLFPEYEFRES